MKPTYTISKEIADLCRAPPASPCSVSILTTVHNKGAVDYGDVPGFCKTTKLDDIRKHGYVLTPGRYVGTEVSDDDGEPFDEKMKRLTSTLGTQQATGAKLDAAIASKLKELGYGG